MTDNKNWKSMRPKLVRRNAERRPMPEIVDNSDKDCIDFNVLDDYNDHLYSSSNCNKVVDGYVRDINNNEFEWIIPSDINNICLRYYFLDNAATFQIAYNLWKSCKKIKKRSQCLIDDNIYNFSISARIEFQEYRKYLKKRKKRDRNGWNIGTVVEIKSYTYNNEWILSTIISIKDDNITVVFGKKHKLIKKIVNRYDYKSIRSTSTFINDRKRLNIDSMIKIYCNYDDKWYNGLIKKIFISDSTRSYIETIKIEYKNSDSTIIKMVNRWSSEIKMINSKYSKYSNIDSLSDYQEGNYYNVWSKTQNRWVPAIIKMIIPINHCILVKYGKSQKVVEIE